MVLNFIGYFYSGLKKMALSQSARFKRSILDILLKWSILAYTSPASLPDYALLGPSVLDLTRNFDKDIE